MNYKVKHKYTGLYYQPTTASGSNMGKKGKVYTSENNSCLTGSYNTIGITIKKDSPIYKKYYDMLIEHYHDESSRPEHHAFFSIPKKDFEKEYVTVDINLLTNIIKNKKAQYCDNVILNKCLDDILKLIKNN